MRVGQIGLGQFWEAYSAPGKPWCVSGSAPYDGDLSVNLYFSKKGRLKGVIVYDVDEVVVVGKVPKSKREVTE